MRTIWRSSFFLFMLSFLVVASVLPARALDLTLLHVNDSHSYLDPTGDSLILGGEPTSARLGGWERLARAVDGVRAEGGNVLLLHAGDAVQGDLFFLKYDGRPEMELLDRFGFAAMTLGNHEFDRGAGFLARMLGHASLPVLAANIDASGVPGLAARLKPYVVLDVAGEKIGVVGLTDVDTGSVSNPGPGVRFTDDEAAARRAVAALQADGVNKIILLTHVGLARDRELAASVPGVDVIVGGHSHSLLGDPVAMKALGKVVDDDYPVTVKGADGHDVYVVTAWKWSRVLGRLDLRFDADGRIVSIGGGPVLLVDDDFKRKDDSGRQADLTGEARRAVLADLKASPVVRVAEGEPAEPGSLAATTREYLRPFEQGVAAMRTEVIGRAAKPLPHIRVPGVDENGRDLRGGSLLAPLVCRSMLDRLAATAEPADLALINAGGVRHDLEQGDITVGMAYTLLPFNNTLFVLEMTGDQLRRALEIGVGRGGGAFPYMAGARYEADMNRPAGERVREVAVGGKDGGFAPLDLARTYRVVTSAFLAGGGDAYTVMDEIADRTDTGFVDALTFIDYVKAVKILEPPSSSGVTYIPAR